MDTRRVLTRLVLALASMALVLVAVSLLLSYRASVRQVEAELRVSAASWARVVAAVAGEREGTVGSGAADEVLRRLAEDPELDPPADDPSVEVLVVTRVADRLHFLLARSHDSDTLPAPIALGEGRSVPAQRGLEGFRGVVRGPNHHGEPVLAGVHPLPGEDAAVVVQRELAALQAPFWRVGGLAAGLAVLLGLVGLAVVRRSTRALDRGLQRLETERDRLDRRVRLAVEGVGVGFWEVDFGEHRWHFSRQLREDLGYGEDELEPTLEEWDRLVHPDDWAAVEAAADRFRSGSSRTYDMRYRLRAADGTWRWIHSQGLMDETRPSHAFGIHWDVTSQMEALERARRQERRLGAILQTLPSSTVSILDEELRYLYLADDIGPGPSLDPDASVGDPVGGSLPADAARNVRAHLKAALRGAEVDVEVERDGRHLLVRATPMAEDGAERVLTLVVDVSEQKRRERIVHQQRQQLDHIVRSIPGGVVTVVSRERTIVFTAGEPLVRAGIDPAERIGTSIMDWVVPEERPEVSRILDRVFAGESARYETRLSGAYRGTDGEVGLSFAVGPIHGPDGSVEEVLLLSVDITEELAARDTLQDTRDRLEMALEAGRHGIFDFDPRGGALYVSDTYASIFGWDPSDFQETFEDWEARLHPEDREETMSAVRRHMAGESDEVHEGEYRARHADGSWIWIRAVARIIAADDDGVPTRVLGTITDITEERAASRQRELLSTAVRQSSNLVLVTDRDGRIEYVNPEFSRVTGYDAGEVVGESLEWLAAEGDSGETFRRMWATLEQGEAFEEELAQRTRDGGEYLQQTTISPIQAPDGTILAYVSIGRDVTGERLLQEQLRQSQKMEAMGQLTGGVAHDFNNILTGILTNAGLARRDLPEGWTEIDEELAEIEQSAERGAKLIRKIMAFSRDDYLELAPAHLVELVEDAAGLLRRTLPERIVLRVEDDGSGPVAEVDPVAVQQILVNLANNARDAMPAGGSLTLRAATRVEEGIQLAVLEVEDTGTGMDDAVARRVFEPFFTTRSDGTGLGLAMAYALTHRQNGHITLETDVGEGTCFRVAFPASDASPAPAPEEPSKKKAIQGEGTILVVEDEATVRRVARRVLERAGYRVLEAVDGRAGLELLLERSGEVDLVLTDMVMPEMGGAALHEAMEAHGMGLPFVFTSGYADRELSGGHNVVTTKPFLRKPWDAEELLRIVGRVLDERTRAR